MSRLTPLLEVQELDLSSDRLVARREVLPERERIRGIEAVLGSIEAAHAALLEERRSVSLAEHALAVEVESMAARAKDVETTLYSGTVRGSKELSGLQTEMQMFRARQAEIEARELGLLESIDRIEAEMARNRAERQRCTVELDGAREALAAAERAIDDEVAGLRSQRGERVVDLPEPILAAYEKIRTRARLAGRAAARLVDGGCSGCHMRLPVHEHNLLQARPEDDLLVCVHCGRILVRTAIVVAPDLGGIRA